MGTVRKTMLVYYHTVNRTVNYTVKNIYCTMDNYWRGFNLSQSIKYCMIIKAGSVSRRDYRAVQSTI